MKPHKHAEVIKAWADGAKVQIYSSDEWMDIADPKWGGDKYRIKPEPPAKVYPVTGMTTAEKSTLWARSPDHHIEAVTFFANAALRHAIDSGQLVSADHEVVVMGRTSRAARDMAIAEAVRNACGNYFGWSKFFGEIDLPAIIATVKD